MPGRAAPGAESLALRYNILHIICIIKVFSFASGHVSYTKLNLDLDPGKPDPYSFFYFKPLYFDAHFVVISRPCIYTRCLCIVWPKLLSFPLLMASDSVGTADVTSKMIQWSPQPAQVAADKQLYLHTLVVHNHTYSIVSSDSISTLKLKLYGCNCMELQVLDSAASANSDMCKSAASS